MFSVLYVQQVGARTSSITLARREMRARDRPQVYSVGQSQAQLVGK